MILRPASSLRFVSVVVLAIVAAFCAGNDPLAPSQPSGVTMPSFTSGRWNLKIDRAWNAANGTVQFPQQQLPDSTYDPVTGGETYVVVVTDRGRKVTIGQTPFEAQLAKTTDSSLEYTITAGTFAGGRFLVWTTAAGGLQAELTIYGSGMPIIKSERGPLVVAAP